MKSPLSFLARLVARGRSAEPQQLLAAPDRNADVAKPEVQPAPIVERADEPEAPIESPVLQSIAAEAPSEVAEAEVGIGSDEPVTIPLTEERADIEQEPARTVDKKRAPRIAKTAPADHAFVAQVAAGVDQSGQSPVSTRGIYSDEVDLDAEIAELRKQLSQKLRLQNAQLKKRLERFDRF